MSARIVLEPDVKEVRLSAGENATVRLTVTNNSDVVDAFDLTINNLDPSWYTLAPEHVSLFPRAQATVDLQIKPPPGPATLAGAYPFQIMAVSRDTPTETANVVILFYVLGASELAMAIEPQRIVARKGSYRLKLTNAGNIERPVVLHPSDPDALLVFAFGKARAGSIDAANRRSNTDIYIGTHTAGKQTTPLQPSAVETEWTVPDQMDAQGALLTALPPASIVELPLHVQTKRRIWFGRQRNLRFEVKATPPGVEWEEKDAKKIAGELVYDPYLAAWSALPLLLRRLAMIALVLAILGLLLFLLLRTPPTLAGTTGTPTPVGPTSAQMTATANAAASQTAAAQATAVAATAIARSGQVSSADQTATAVAGLQSKLPKIDKFDLAFAQDGSAMAAWQTSNAVTVTLNGVKVDPVGSQPVDTTTNQSLVLVAANPKGQVSQSKGIFLVRSPEIKSFVADPAGPVCSGCEVTLRWTTSHADQVTLDDTPVPDSDRNTGSIKVKPDQSADYVLTAQNAVDQVKRSVVVPVIVTTPKP